MDWPDRWIIGLACWLDGLLPKLSAWLFRRADDAARRLMVRAYARRRARRQRG